MNTITAAITAVGAYVPDFVLSNEVLETMVDTNDEWITTRTGIKERRLLKENGKGTSYLAIKAAKDLIAEGVRLEVRASAGVLADIEAADGDGVDAAAGRVGDAIVGEHAVFAGVLDD